MDTEREVKVLNFCEELYPLPSYGLLIVETKLPPHGGQINEDYDPMNPFNESYSWYFESIPLWYNELNFYEEKEIRVIGARKKERIDKEILEENTGHKVLFFPYMYILDSNILKQFLIYFDKIFIIGEKRESFIGKYRDNHEFVTKMDEISEFISVIDPNDFNNH